MQEAYGTRSGRGQKETEKAGHKKPAALPKEDEGLRLVPQGEPEGKGEAYKKGGFPL